MRGKAHGGWSAVAVWAALMLGALALPLGAGAQSLVPSLKQLSTPQTSVVPAKPAPPLERVRISNSSGQPLEVQLLPKGEDPKGKAWKSYVVNSGIAISLDRATASQFSSIRVVTQAASGPPHIALYEFSPDAWYDLYANPATKAWDIRRVPAG